MTLLQRTTKVTGIKGETRLHEDPIFIQNDIAYRIKCESTNHQGNCLKPTRTYAAAKEYYQCHFPYKTEKSCFSFSMENDISSTLSQPRMSVHTNIIPSIPNKKTSVFTRFLMRVAHSLDTFLFGFLKKGRT